MDERLDTALEASQLGIRAVKVSLLALSVTFVLQAFVVALSGSVALLGDTLHNLTDALTALPLWFAFTLSRRPGSPRYTYGYGRAEDLAGIFIVLVIATSAAVAGIESFRRLLDPRPLDHLGWVIAAGVIGFVGNELVAVFRIRVGRQIGSAALIADGLHARTDGLTSLAVVCGAIGVALGAEAADPIAGLAITAAILLVLFGAARDVFHRLMDAVDPGLVDRVRATKSEVDGVAEVGDVRLRWIGHHLRAEARVAVDGALPLVEAHQVGETATHRLLHDVPRLTSAIVHLDPFAVDGEAYHEAAHHRDPVRGATDD